MTTPLSYYAEKQLVEDLLQETSSRAKAEKEAAATRDDLTVEIEEKYARDKKKHEERVETETRELEEKFDREVRECKDAYEDETASANAELHATTSELQEKFARRQESSGEKLEEAKWEASAMFDASKDSLEGPFGPQQEWINQKAETLKDLRASFGRWRKQLNLPASPKAQGQYEEPFGHLKNNLAAAEQYAAELESYRGGAVGRIFLWAFMFLATAGVVGLGAKVILEKKGWLLWEWASAAGGATVVLFALVFLIATVLRKGSMKRLCTGLGETLSEAEAANEQCQERLLRHREQQHNKSKSKLDKQTEALDQKFKQRIKELKRAHAQAVAKAEAEHKAKTADATKIRDETLKEIEARRGPAFEELKRRHKEAGEQIEAEHTRATDEALADHRRAWQETADRWKNAVTGVQTAVEELHQTNTALFPEWEQQDWDAWNAPADVPAGIRFGEMDIKIEDIPGGVPADEQLREIACLSDFTLPALLPFPKQGSLMYRAADKARDEAVRSLQAVMLRYLTALPAGKVRFTIIDPVGLGENFAGFMHLSDYDEQMVSNRIWTEAEHIEHRLADMTEHLENVIQTYLRNQFETIEQYNRDAGEVAEPFRLLVIANFPANFTEAAARRLLSIVSSGARCGVYTLITVDSKRKLPQGFDLKDLEQHCTVLKHVPDRGFVWLEETFREYPLTLDEPPGEKLFSKIIHNVGAAAKEASKVEVPFRYISPPEEDWWKDSCAKELICPLGKAGATKLQPLQLGRGTSQHGLVAGKTGSGKSTMLHVLITNLCLRYSPDEVQLYLVDFKKGVEFKTYAAHKLPHARVVAVESEREFGLSVLQRLDEELKLRGEEFRKLEVQDLAAYRKASGKPLPRILLLIDEFQEIFTEDDWVSQEASLLLDRLVRQGRAFGMHALLGSQTLGGAYSLARATLGQMAVRIALECSEADASLILSEGNTAARLLSRPGEAIYNDANGRIEGNKVFQICWLPDEEREVYLDKLVELAERKPFQHRYPQIVFEGNVPANIDKNHLIEQLLSADDWPADVKVPKAWMGDPVAIKDPSAAEFRRQAAANLLICGQKEEQALGIMAAAFLSLAAQHPAHNGASSARFYILDGTREDSEFAGYFERLAACVPHEVEVRGWRDTKEVLKTIGEEVDRRTEENDTDEQAIYLFVHDLGRFRDLRKGDDFDFAPSPSFSFDDDADDDLDSPAAAPEVPPAKRMSTILKEGSAFGVHTLCWADSYNNLSRTFDRQSLREFELRVLFQMSGDDSSNLIDNPSASNLGENRAFFYSEEQGQLEKFRPYNPPEPDWLDHVKERLGARSVVEASE